VPNTCAWGIICNASDIGEQACILCQDIVQQVGLLPFLRLTCKLIRDLAYTTPMDNTQLKTVNVNMETDGKPTINVD
jgi:hypothetical protein